MPFKCSYCGKLFCAEHRLPEKHDCSSLPKTPPSYIVEKFESAQLKKALDGLERAKNAILKRSQRRGLLDKVEK